jgi:hypothetical protein
LRIETALVAVTSFGIAWGSLWPETWQDTQPIRVILATDANNEVDDRDAIMRDFYRIMEHYRLAGTSP